MRHSACLISIALSLIWGGCGGTAILRDGNSNDNSNANTNTGPNSNENTSGTSGNATGNTNGNSSVSDGNANINENAGQANANENGSPDEIDTCGNAVGNGDEVIAGPSEPGEGDRDSVFRSLTVHPTNADILWVGSERNGILKSVDGGSTWTRQRVGLRHINELYPEVWDIAVSASDPDILFAATLDSPGPVTGDYPSSVAGVYKSTDGGETWKRTNCGIDSSRVNSVRIDAADPNSVTVGVEGGMPSFDALAGEYSFGGLYHSIDGGENWTEVAIDANDGMNGFTHLKLRGAKPSTLVTFGMNRDDLSGNHGFLISTDSGENWAKFAAPLSDLFVPEFDVSADGTVICALERDAFVIHKSADSGQSWSEIPLSNANGPIAISPGDDQIILFGSSSTLSRSSDGLSSSAAVLTPASTIEDIVFAPSDPNVVYVGAVGLLIYKSTNAGQTFTLVANLRSDVLNQP